MAPRSVDLLALATVVLPLWALMGCAAGERMDEEPSDPKTMVRLIAKPDYTGPLFIIHDPLRGIDPPLEPDGYHYRFDDRGVLRVKTEEQWGLGGKWVKAFDRSGNSVPYKRGEWGSRKGDLSVAVWVILRHSEDFETLYYDDHNLELTDQLRRRGESDLVWTPERRALHAAFNAEANREPPSPFPQIPGPDQPQPVFEVPAGYLGPIYLITDPFHGTLPASEGDRLLFRFPANGVLRVKLTEAMSASRSWPLVYDASGAQLWLRPWARNSGFDTLPITCYLVCPNATDLPPHPDPARISLKEQLHALGVTDLEWSLSSGDHEPR